MTQTMTKVEAAPAWIQAFSDAIDALNFEHGFEKVHADTAWSFGVRHGRGPDKLKDFFHQIDDGLDTSHRLLEAWSGEDQHIVRGVADLKPKGDGGKPTPVPFVWIFYMDPDDTERLRQIYIVNGPVKTESLL